MKYQFFVYKAFGLDYLDTKYIRFMSKFLYYKMRFSYFNKLRFETSIKLQSLSTNFILIENIYMFYYLKRTVFDYILQKI